MVIATSSAAARGWPTPAAGSSASGDPELVLTFDDGPSPKTTPEVLDILKEHHLHAVFFLVGEMVDSKNKKVPAIVERILREGHIIGNHTMTHADLCRVKEDKAEHEIDDGKAAITRVAGFEPVWIRVPYGARCDRLEAQLAARHLTHFHWDLDPQEWKHGDVKRTVHYVTTQLEHASGRNVLLMHDIKVATVKALPQILTWIDEENARRAAAHRRPIRIVPAPQVALEQIPKPLVAWAIDTSGSVRQLPQLLASVLP